MSTEIVTIALAPMEGVVDPIIRKLYSRIGGYDHFVTEFVRVSDRLLPASLFYRYSPELLTGGRTAEGYPVFVQILGGQPAVIAENAALAKELGAPGIDLNFGCPAKTVNRHDGGAALLQKPERLFDIISSVKRAVGSEMPVTAKVRLGFNDKSLCDEIAQAVAEAEATSITIHARTKIEGYKPPAHWEYIARMKEVIRGKIPVIANGDIWSLADYIKCKEITGCARVALGRGAFSKPDLALLIKAYANGETQPEMSWGELHESWLGHFIAQSAQVNEPFAIRRTKQWVKFLGREYEGAKQSFENIKRCQTLQEIKSQLQLN